MKCALTGQSIISWIGAMTNASLIYLFRPTRSIASTSSGHSHLNTLTSAYTANPTLVAVLPVLIPLAAIALAASHGHIVLRWIVDSIAERVLWRGSVEEVEVQKLRLRGIGEVREQLERLDMESKRDLGGESSGAFWNGGEEGARAIASAGKVE